MRIKPGDEVAFKEFYQQCWNPRRSEAVFLIKTYSFIDPDDVVQDVMMGIWQGRSTLPENACVAYLQAAVYFKVVDSLRMNASARKYRWEMLSGVDGTLNHDVDHLVKWAAASEEKNLIGSLIVGVEALSPMVQRTILLRHFAGMKPRQIAKVLNVSVITVKNNDQIGKNKLRNYFQSRNQGL